MTQEIERIQREYRRRDQSLLNAAYQPGNTAWQMVRDERERCAARSFQRAGLNTLANRRVLDVGCGDGSVLASFLKYGLKPTHGYGIDLMENRIAIARRTHPGFQFLVGNGADLPFEEKTFDIITQFTCFSSVLNTAVRQRIAGEMIRVLKPDGIILWYDLRPRWGIRRCLRLPPQTHHTAQPTPTLAISRNDIHRLFPGFRVQGCRLTPDERLWPLINRFPWTMPFFRLITSTQIASFYIISPTHHAA